MILLPLPYQRPPKSPSRSGVGAWAVVVTACLALGAGGCTAYHVAPLTKERVDAALRPAARGEVRVAAELLRHPLLPPVRFSARDDGLSPEQAAVFAVVANPKLRSVRDARGLAAAQVIQAGILPNPQLTPSLDVPVGNNGVPGIKTAYGFNLNWDVTALFLRGPRLDAARAHAGSVDLSVAWQEWQVAEAAKLAVFQLASLRRQVALAREIEGSFQRNAALLREAVQRHEKIITDLAPVEAAAQQARSDRLLVEQGEADARLALNHALGLPPEAAVRLRAGLRFPGVADAERLAGRDLLAGFEERRLDLVALRLGYASQEATLRTAVRAQFPKITLGLFRSSDNGNLKSLGPNAVFDLPFFDRNQGNVAAETATRQQLFDDYTGRVYDARADAAKVSTDLRFTARREQAARAAVPALEHLTTGYEQALQLGAVDVLLVNAARQSLGAKRLEAERLRGEVAALVIALELATGQPSLAPRSDR